jgi:hypothetical protein
MRGLDTAGRWFGCERYCCLQTSVTVDLGRIALWLLGSLQIGSLTAPTSVSTGQPSLMAAAYMVASDQHQPDNSRATATLATKGFFFRSVKPCHLP